MHLKSSSCKRLIQLALVLMCIGILCVIFNPTLVRPFASVVMTKKSPLGTPTAKLLRINGFDTKFELWIGGRRVYSSADFAPSNLDFREQIAWDKSGRHVVLFVAGERVFGYDALDRRPLTASETMAAQFTPIEDLRYEGTLPIQLDEQNDTVAPP